MNFVRTTLLSLAVLLTASVALAQGTYTQIDYPGALATRCIGINTVGDIAGYYEAGNRWHGFLLRGGAYTTIEAPNAQDTYALGINDVGQIVGFTNYGIGFKYDVQTKAFSPITYPGVHRTFPTSINNAGTIVGFFFNGRGYEGFTLSGSSYSSFVPPHGSILYNLGITALNVIVGSAVIRPTSEQINFSFDQGKYKRLRIPHAPSASVSAVSPDGLAIGGIYSPTPRISAGFVYQNGFLSTLRFPGRTQTFAEGINDTGAVVGEFLDTSDPFHGFLWTPPPDAAKKSSNSR